MVEKVAIVFLLAVALVGFFYGSFYGRRLSSTGEGLRFRLHWPAARGPEDARNRARTMFGMGVFVVAIGVMLFVTKVWGPVAF
jgi:hypothetical protein